MINTLIETSDSETTFTYNPADNSTAWSKIKTNTLRRITLMTRSFSQDVNQNKSKIVNNMSKRISYTRQIKHLLYCTHLFIQTFQILRPDSKD